MLEILHARFRQRLEIDHDARLVLGVRIFFDLPGEVLSRHRVRQHLQHSGRAPYVLLGVVIVDHRHHLQIDGRILRLQRLQKRGELRIVVRVETAVRGNRVQRLGDQQVEIADSELRARRARCSRRSRKRRRAADRSSAALCRAPPLSSVRPRGALFGFQRIACRPACVSGRRISGSSGLRPMLSRKIRRTSVNRPPAISSASRVLRQRRRS